MKIIEPIELKVKKPKIIQVDKKGTVDLANGWLIGGGTKHIWTFHWTSRDRGIPRT